MPIEPIKIPQNVYIEDRIVGPLTLKQILITSIGAGFSYILYSTIAKAYGSVPLPIVVMVWIPALIAGIFAFVRINDLSMMHLLLLTLERLSKPGIRTWAPRRGIVINIRMFTTPGDKEKRPQGPGKTVDPRHIHELSTILDQPLSALSTMDEPAPLSPLEEDIPKEQTQEPVAVPRPVNRTRISAVPLRADADMDIAAVPPQSGTVSIFRDISPRP